VLSFFRWRIFRDITLIGWNEIFSDDLSVNKINA